MQKQIQFILVSIFLVLGISCQQKAATYDHTAATSSGSWSEQMQNLADVLTSLIPVVNSSSSFNNPENKDLINSNIEKLHKLAHNLSEKQMKFDSDPSLGIISTQFSDDINRAEEAIKVGHREYARHLLKSSTSYCIQCHTRNSVGPNFSDGRFSDALKSMSPLDRGEFFTATRQFDRALSEYKDVLANQAGKGFNVVAWERAARHGLAIAVRFMKSTEKTEEIISLIQKSPNAPVFLKEDASEWRKSIAVWKKEPDDQTYKDIKQSLAAARKLISKAQDLQEYSTDHAGDIYYLRATTILHSTLAMRLSNSEKSEALYLIGNAYDALRDLNFWTLHEQYYETCIRSSPRSSIASKCFKKYEQSILFGFSGSAGFVLPADVQLKLSELRALSSITTKK